MQITPTIADWWRTLTANFADPFQPQETSGPSNRAGAQMRRPAEGNSTRIVPAGDRSVGLFSLVGLGRANKADSATG